MLVTQPTGDTYSVSLVGIDGKVVATAQPSSPTNVTCGDAAAAVLPLPVSTSNTRVYYMDAQGVVYFLTPNGETGRATTVPAGGQRRSMFAVSPDDQRIAVITATYTKSGATTAIYVEDLNGGTHHVNIFSESGGYSLWPIGWHAGLLVVAKVPSCTQGGGPFCCGPLELHVVDPATAVRRYTIGGPNCVIVGAASPGGVTCEDPTFVILNEVNWTGGIFEHWPIIGPTPAYLSPNGSDVGYVRNGQTSFPTGPTYDGEMCGWIDSNHILIGGGTQSQPQVIPYLVNAPAVPVLAQGTCGGRIPGGL